MFCATPSGKGLKTLSGDFCAALSSLWCIASIIRPCGPHHPLHPRSIQFRLGVPFATTLAAGILERAASPEALARATILVPSRRAAQALRAAFLEIRGDVATLLPRIDPIGDVEEDAPDLLAFAADGIDLPPPMDPLQRQLWLSRLLRGFRLGEVAPTVPQTVRLAEALARLLDQLGNADATPDMLRDLCPTDFHCTGRIF